MLMVVAVALSGDHDGVEQGDDYDDDGDGDGDHDADGSDGGDGDVLDWPCSIMTCLFDRCSTSTMFSSPCRLTVLMESPQESGRKFEKAPQKSGRTFETKDMTIQTTATFASILNSALSESTGIASAAPVLGCRLVRVTISTTFGLLILVLKA